MFGQQGEQHYVLPSQCYYRYNVSVLLEIGAGCGPRPKQQLTRWVAFKAAIKAPLQTELLLRFRAPSVRVLGIFKGTSGSCGETRLGQRGPQGLRLKDNMGVHVDNLLDEGFYTISMGA